MSELVRLRWHPANAPGVLHAIEPTVADIELHAAQLAAAYNDPHNAVLMGNTNAISIKQTAIKYPADKAANAQPTPNSVAATMTRFRANAKPYKHKPAAANCTDMPPKKCPAIIKPAQPIKIKATL